MHQPLVKARKELRAIAVIALPIIFAQLLQMGMGVIDTLMAGRINALTLAAVALGAAIWFFVFLVGIGLMLALTPIISHHIGANNHPLIREELRQGIWLALTLSLMLMLLLWLVAALMPYLGIEEEIIPETHRYLRWIAWSLPFTCLYLVPRFLNESMGHTMPMLWIQVLLLPLNVLGNYTFMFGNFGFPAMHAAGCALSTGISQTIGCLALYAYTLYTPRYAEYDLRKRMTLPDWAHIANIVRLGLPISIGMATESGMFTATALLMGRFGVDAVAGHQIAINIASITFMIPLGISIALTVRTGQALGAGQQLTARYRGRLGIALCGAFMFVSAFVLWTMGGFLASLYTSNKAVLVIATQFLAYAAVFQLVDGMQVGAMGVLRGYKDTKIPMLVTVFCYWIIGMGISLGLGVFGPMGPAGLWAGLVGGLLVAAITLNIRFYRLSRTAQDKPGTT
ncbi:MAG: MATE family efflux transporter [Gammaproteobacteria bacterium]|nr:MATE family efflux transporter [Gammaproteobacteria bacterium]